ncbi:hypothetical protein E2C01_064845 [Portunus trituberculatus]|uniref:Uncharacterized protein n=1 Tax=Portunus trituberculatus TaxID=210409 RepID=A0A5B7HCX0_PORTR|nr:hypothetical protein [Portunus trituberculatus]
MTESPSSLGYLCSAKEKHHTGHNAARMLLTKRFAGNEEESNVATNLETTKAAEHLFICELLSAHKDRLQKFKVYFLN